MQKRTIRKERGALCPYPIAAATRVHGPRCGRALSASWRITRLRFPMRIRKSTPIGGAATRPLDRKPGSAWRSGCATSAWNWGINWSRLPCASPSLLLPSRRRVSQLPRVRPHPLLPLDTVHLPLPLPGKQGASPEPTFLSSPTGRSGIQQGNRFLPRSAVERPMGVCMSCMRRAFAVVAPVRCVSSVSGRAAPPKSRAR